MNYEELIREFGIIKDGFFEAIMDGNWEQAHLLHQQTQGFAATVYTSGFPYLGLQVEKEAERMLDEIYFQTTN